MLPEWQGADDAYRRAYRMLHNMAQRGHATPATGYWRRGRWVQTKAGWVTGELDAFVDALNSGDEERVKANILANLQYLHNQEGIQ